MESRDSVLFLLSTDWFYLENVRVSQILPIDPRQGELVKNAARDCVKEILSNAENYYLIDFSETRTAKTLNNFFRRIEKSISSSDFYEVKKFVEAIVNSSRDFVGDLSVLRMAYAIGYGKMEGIYSSLRLVCDHDEIINFMADETLFIRPDTAWDAWLLSVFDENYSEVMDFYSAVVVPIFFAKRISKIVFLLREEIREVVYDLIYKVSCEYLYFAISRERIVFAHEKSALEIFK